VWITGVRVKISIGPWLIAAKLFPNKLNITKQKSARSKPLFGDNFADIGQELIEIFRKSKFTN
jgi:hypothetical protein